MTTVMNLFHPISGKGLVHALCTPEDDFWALQHVNFCFGNGCHQLAVSRCDFSGRRLSHAAGGCRLATRVEDGSAG